MSPGTSSRLRVVAVRVVRLEHAQAVLDGDAGRDDEEAAGEALALRPADGVDGLPGDEHGHDRGLAGAGGQLEGEPHQLRDWRRCSRWRGGRGSACPRARSGATSVSQIAVSTASTWQKNGRMPLNSWCRQCWRRRAVSGVTCQWLGFGRCAPLVHVAAQLVDDRRRVVLLRGGRDAGALVEDDPLLPGALVLLRPGDRRDEAGRAPRLDEPSGRLAVRVELPVAAGVGVGRVEDRPLEEGAVSHGTSGPPCQQGTVTRRGG